MNSKVQVICFMVACIVLSSVNTLRIASHAKLLIPPPFEEENAMTNTECNDKNECIIFILSRTCHIHEATCFNLLLVFFILDLILVTLSLLN